MTIKLKSDLVRTLSPLSGAIYILILNVFNPFYQLKMKNKMVIYYGLFS